MIKNIIGKLHTLDSKTKNIMKYGFIFALIISIISGIVLFTYQAFYSSPDLYYIGLQMFKISLTIGVSFFVCGIIVDTIKKRVI